ncbi:MAG: LytTR family DNA-binding domain-containing protein [Armatimonadota bacterium]|nr:LytTR family DNA-binding domain-containing protein [Armatimonadota bacterium]MDR7487142.1 LytTR family DNA-binding domain-containing protein [Armatimonadota bacterium]MDR7533548.1 LytTR family DNA-binding domain-containing protein [Armatimonadota bacterium]MDR7536862.1 LytTR family DNA-binding domain-containing protein [Armatimonadota bacterium]
MTRILRALVADDEAPARAHLRELLDESGVRVVAECASGRQVLAALEAARPDLVCLDVRMPDLDGVEVARHLGPARRPVVVFTTGFADYAAAAYDLDAADYLLKPLSAARVREAVRRVHARLRSAEAGPAAPGVVPRLFLAVGDHRLAVPPASIAYVEARGTACVVYGDAGTVTVRAPLARFEQALCAHGFLRTHRAYLVNLCRVRALVPWSRHVHTLLLDGPQETHVPVAKSRLAAFRRSVIWMAAGGAHGVGAAGARGGRGRGEPGTRPRDR